MELKSSRSLVQRPYHFSFYKSFACLCFRYDVVHGTFVAPEMFDDADSAADLIVDQVLSDGPMYKVTTILSHYYGVSYYDISYYDAWQISRPQGIALALPLLPFLFVCIFYFL
jgi:hypothetical protein